MKILNYNENRYTANCFVRPCKYFKVIFVFLNEDFSMRERRRQLRAPFAANEIDSDADYRVYAQNQFYAIITPYALTIRDFPWLPHSAI